MQQYVIYKSHDGTSLGITSIESWNNQPSIHQVDLDGEKMDVVKVFSAESWEEAMEEYYLVNNLGKYIPF